MSGTTADNTLWTASYIDNNTSSGNGYPSAGKTILTPFLNLTNGTATWTYTITFSLSEDLALSDINFALFSINADANGASGGRGNSFGSNRYGSQAITLSNSSDTLLYTGKNDEVKYVGTSESKLTGAPAVTVNTTTGALAIAKSSGAATNYNLSEQVTLLAKEQYTLKLTVHAIEKPGGGYDNNFALGIGAISFSGQVVPEPATATLSLLALAGLCARRRRK